MERSSGDAAPTQAPDLGEGETAAFPLRPAGGGEDAYTIAPGTVVARKYRVTRTIGRGGMGVVVEARHEGLDTRVAIKLLLPEFQGHAEASERFTREARAVARLHSPHVVRVLDVGVLERGEPFMVMEYLEGEDLARRVEAEGALPIADAIDHVVQACDALAEAHARDIVHRDLKPANLFLTRRPDGSPLVKLLDFGISKMLGEGSGDVRLTSTTTILGSVLYMSPEQMRSAKAVDHRTDIYALGACLFEMIGGRPPYSAESFPELCAKVYTSPPEPLRALRPEAPEGLVEVLEKSLARDPAKRHQSVAELVQALAPYAREDTRAAIAALLRQHAPTLDLPPRALAEAARLPAPTAEPPRASALPEPPRASAPAEPVRPAEPRPREPARGGRGALVIVGAAVVTAIAWGTLRVRGPDGDSAAASAGAADTGEVGAANAGAAPAGAPDPAAPIGAVVSAAGGGEHAAAERPSELAGAAADRGERAAADGGGPDAGATKKESRGGAAQASGGAKPAATPGGKGPAAPEEREPGEGAAGTPVMPGATGKTPPPPVNTDLVQETCFATMPDGRRKTVPCD